RPTCGRCTRRRCRERPPWRSAAHVRRRDLHPGVTRNATEGVPYRFGRRSMSRLAALTLLCCGLFALAAEVEPKQKVGDWLLFRRTPEQTGFTTAKAPEKLEVLWSFKTGDSIESAVAV